MSLAGRIHSILRRNRSVPHPLPRFTAATLKTGEEVVIKVQRKGIYETMARDIGLMHKAVRLMPPVSIKGMVDLNMVLSELWTVTQEEMNFLTEAANMAEFAKKNKDVAFVKVPILYREYTSPSYSGDGIY